MPEDDKKKGGMELMIAMGKPKSAPPEEVVDEAMEEGEPIEEEVAEKSMFSLPIPKGYEPPVEDGKEWEEVVKFRKGEDGGLRVVKIGSVSTDDESEAEEEPYEEVDGTGGYETPMEVEPVEPNASKALGSAIKLERGR